MPQSQFQSFEESADPSQGAARTAALRAELSRRGLDGFIVPRADEHQGEYVPANAERLAWLTGFTGSAGVAIVLRDSACVIVDGRYTLQVREQVDTQVFEPVALVETTPEAWIGAHLPKGARFGFDPWLATADGRKRLEKAIAKAGGELVATDGNPLDVVWTDRPAPPLAPVQLYDEKLAGEAAGDKLARVRDALGAAGLGAEIVSDPHNLAWLLNIRGGDVPHSPLVLAYALVPREGRPVLFIDPAKLTQPVSERLKELADLAPPGDLVPALAALGREKISVGIDAATGAAALVDALEAAGGSAEVRPDPITLMKARKNAAEIEGSRSAHRRDGTAVTRFLHWFANEAPRGRVTEIDAVEALEDARRQTNALRDISFPTISGAGANGAIVHYRVTRNTNQPIGEGLFLIDSGAQYVDGTTDITRTLAVGTPSPEMRDRFTRVLKGNIAIATAIFPKGTNGAQLDSFARRPLWEAGLDFEHGTGHGVGAYLSVHEGPQRISKLGTVALEPGMILSNEPGYYKTGAYGIRIENLLVVEEREVPGAEKPMLGFETLTLAPIDLALVEPALLSEAERDWLDAYHARVRETLSPQLDAPTAAWLVEATRPLRAAKA